MSTPPPNPPGPTPPQPGATAPPYPGGGVPAANPMYPSVQQGYPGISYASQSSTTYNIGGNPPQAGAAPYPVQPGGPPAHPGQHAPYPTPGHVPSYPSTPGSGSPAPGGRPPYPVQGGTAYPSHAAPPYPSHSSGPGGGASYPSTAGGGYPGQGNPPYSPQGSAGQGNPPYPPQGSTAQGNAPYPTQGTPGKGNAPYPPQGSPGQGSAPYPPQGPAGQGSAPYPPQGPAGQGSAPYPPQGPAGQGSAPYPPQGPPAQGNPPYPPQGSAAYPGQGGPPRVPPRVSQPAPGHHGSGYPTQPGGPAAPYPSGGSQPGMPPGAAQPYPGGQSNVFGRAGQGAHNAYQQPGFSAVPQSAPGMDVASRGYMQPMKKALIVGCNYHRTSAELKGCINDAKCMKYLLMTKFGFEERNIRLLTDDQAGRQRPTKQYIIEGMHWLVEGAQPGSSLFFHFSGHGSQKRDYVGDEQDGFNETLLPTDYKTAGQIVDDDVNRFIVNSLGPGVTLHAVIDACHSGTAMDLKYRTKFKSGHWVWKDTGTTKKYKGTKGGIAFQFGACKDSEVAQDTNDLSGNAYTGAATFAFIQAIETGGPSQSYAAILTHMHRCLQETVNGGLGGGTGGGIIGMLLNGAAKIAGVGKQTPQLSCSEQYDVLQHLRI